MIRAAALLVVLLAASLAAMDPQARSAAARGDVVALKAIDVAPGSLRLGRGVEGAIPKRGWLLSLPRQHFVLLDLDGDGGIDCRGRDGLALEGFPFVVALVEPLWCEAGQVALTVDAKKACATLDVEDLGLDRPLVSDASAVNEVRVRAGLPLVRLDESLCRACEKHCDYLRAYLSRRRARGAGAGWRDTRRDDDRGSKGSR